MHGFVARTLRVAPLALAAAVAGCSAPSSQSPAPTVATDPLPSWNDTAAKRAIVAFVEQVSAEGTPDFVPAPDRIAAGQYR